MDDPQQEAYDLAREHIAAAKAGGERGLNLSPRTLYFDGKTYAGNERFARLTALPPEITELTARQGLSLEDTQVADIAPLTGLTALQWLELGGTQVADIAPLAGLTALQTLRFSFTQVADIAPLAGLTALQELDLTGTQVADIAPLAGLTALQTLYLQDTQVADIAPLAKLTALQTLTVGSKRVADIAPLAGLTALQSLHLSNTRVADIASLARLTALQSLYLGRSQVADIAPLAKLTALQTLTLEGTQVADIDPLKGLEKLRNLDFSNIPACAADPKLAELSEIRDNEERTRRTLAYLRGEAPSDEPESARKPPPDETAPFYSDQPATQDLLNRRAVAETLGTIIDRVWTERRAAEENEKPEPAAGRAERDRTFIVHLHGRWGSGKTSILNFLREVLLSGKIAPPDPKDPRGARDQTFISRLHRLWGSGKTSILNFIGKILGDRAPDPPWVIVDYNAWRNQDLGPAWWTLMDTVYREAVEQLGGWRQDDGLRVRLGHLGWRFRTGWLPAASGILIGLVALYLVFVVDLPEGWGTWGDITKNLSGLIGLIGSFFLLKSEMSILNSRTAKRYVELARDPLGPLTRRYEAMIGEIGRPVAVFIDDLDRCDAAFVVELLQNIQTLFRRAPVLYVVAADRGWICTSYEQVYAPYCEPIAEPGHSLGNMFLEKIFQLSVEVPSLAGAQRKAFWDHLLQTKDKVTPEDREAIDAEVKGQLEEAKTEAEVIRIVDEHAKRSPQRAAIAGARAFQRMQSKELVGEREHFLAGYADLLEANPRAMKRLLNAYGFRRGFDIQSSHRSDPDALVRWTILENRWPILADHLAGRSAGRSDGVLIDALMQDPEVRRVAEGLTREKLRTIAGAPSQSRN